MAVITNHTSGTTVWRQNGVLASVKAILGWRGTPVGPPRLVEPLSSTADKQLRADIEALEFEVA